MSSKVFTAGTTSWTTATNWQGGVAPIDEDTTIFNHQSNANPCTTNVSTADLTGKDFFMRFDEGYTKHIGSSGTPFNPDDIKFCLFKANTLEPSYFLTDQVGKSMQHFVMDTPSTVEGLVELAGTIQRVTIKSGKCNLKSTATINGRANITGSSRNSSLTIPAGVTTTGCEFAIAGGILDCSAAVETLIVNGGEVWWNGSASNITTRLEIYGGVFHWNDGAGTFTYVEVFPGGSLVCDKEVVTRTITETHIHQGANVDFRKGGESIVFTAAPRLYGDAKILWPEGMKLTPSM